MNFKQLIQTLAVTATLLIAQPIQAETFYFHNDHLGTPQALTDDAGTVVWQGNYSPFGEVTETTDTVEQNIRFPGQYFEEETGLHYNYFRDYDPATGRYIESDPIGLVGGINTFGYVGQDPISKTDPLGLYTPNWGKWECLKYDVTNCFFEEAAKSIVSATSTIASAACKGFICTATCTASTVFGETAADFIWSQGKDVFMYRLEQAAPLRQDSCTLFPE